MNVSTKGAILPTLNGNLPVPDFLGPRHSFLSVDRGQSDRGRCRGGMEELAGEVVIEEEVKVTIDCQLLVEGNQLTRWLWIVPAES